MKLPLLTFAVAGVSIAQYAAAVPLRMVAVPAAELPNVRFGHAVSASNRNVAHYAEPAIAVPMAGPGGSRRRPCSSAGRFKEKSIQISNIFRQALGLPIIEEHIIVSNGATVTELHILPHIGTPAMPMPAIGYAGHPSHPMPPPPPPGRPGKHPHHDHHHGHHRHHHHHHKFLNRIHTALMSLGPWEGRAVAFVLGCGIGVLLRMFWVIAVLTYRSVKGTKEPQYIEIITQEELFVTPPEYVDDPDAKKPIVED